MAFLNVYANSASNGVTYSVSNGFSPNPLYVYVGASFVSSAHEQQALEALLPAAERMATQRIKGETSQFMDWINSP